MESTAKLRNREMKKVKIRNIPLMEKGLNFQIKINGKMSMNKIISLGMTF